MNWGALGGGLQGAAAGLQTMEELLRQRRLDEQKKQEQDRLQAEREAASKREQAQLVIQQQKEQRDQEQFGLLKQTNALGRLNQFGYEPTPENALPPEEVAAQQQVGNGGYLRTVGAGQTALPSSRWQGDLYTKQQDPGAAEGVYRRTGPVDRQREDQQRQQREVQAENLRLKDREFAAGQEFRASEGDKNREAKAESDRMRAEMAGTLRSISAQGAADRLQFQKDQATDKKAAVQEKTDQQRQSAINDAQEVHRLAKDLLQEPGFDSLFGLTGQIPIQITPGARNAVVRLNQLTASRAIDRLIDMRRNSPTGGALGNVSDKDIQLLRDASSRLDRQQDPAQARQAVKEIQQAVIKIIGYDPDSVPSTAPSLGKPGQPKIKRYDLQGNLLSD